MPRKRPERPWAAERAGEVAPTWAGAGPNQKDDTCRSGIQPICMSYNSFSSATVFHRNYLFHIVFRFILRFHPISIDGAAPHVHHCTSKLYTPSAFFSPGHLSPCSVILAAPKTVCAARRSATSRGRPFFTSAGDDLQGTSSPFRNKFQIQDLSETGEQRVCLGQIWRSATPAMPTRGTACPFE